MKTNPRVVKSLITSSIVSFMLFGFTFCADQTAYAIRFDGISRSTVSSVEFRETLEAADAAKKKEYKDTYNKVVAEEYQRISDPKSLQSRFVKFAEKFIGTPYTFGGDSPRGFDCSGFVGYVIKRVLDKDVRHSAISQMELGPRVSEPLPGDLVGFGYGNYFGHIGIYIGNGKVIDALNYNKDIGVRELDWMEQYIGPAVFVRIIEPDRNFDPEKITRKLVKFNNAIDDATNKS